MLWEIKPAWPGTEPFVIGRYKDSTPRAIAEDEFLDILATRKVAYIGDWKSPAGPARIFYIATADHDLAIAITSQRDQPVFYKLKPAPPEGAPVRRVKLRR